MASVPWWSRRTIQQKVAAILLFMLLPVGAAVLLHLYVIHELRGVQQRHHGVILAREQVQILRRLTVDIEDAFRGYLLTQDPEFLAPLGEAEAQIPATTALLLDLLRTLPDIRSQIMTANDEVGRLLQSKHALIKRIRDGEAKAVLDYVASREGLRVANTLIHRLRAIEDRLDHRLSLMGDQEAGLATRAFWGLVAIALAGGALGIAGGVLLSRSVTRRVRSLQTAVAEFSARGDPTVLNPPDGANPDELGSLSVAVHDMGRRIEEYLRDLKTLSTIGHDINTLTTDGLGALLQRIADYGVELLHVDRCLVLLYDAPMRCWIVEGASGQGTTSLQKTVMLWEELPVAARAFESNQPMLDDTRGDPCDGTDASHGGVTTLAIPLLSHQNPCGVLVCDLEREVASNWWNVDLASGLAEEAAVAIANVRLYEKVEQQGEGARAHIRELKSLAERIAHDLKAPGERIEGLASLIREDRATQLSGPAARWLALIDQNGKDLRTHVEEVLGLARINTLAAAREAVETTVIVQDVLNAHAQEVEAQGLQVKIEPAMPVVACHPAYVRQIVDHLVRNAVTALRCHSAGVIAISCIGCGQVARLTVADNGPGIPDELRAQVFEPFVRLTDDVVPGKGVGLTVVKRIVESYGGRVSIETSALGGCAVILTLPLWHDLRTAPKDDSTAQPLRWTYGT